MARRIIGILFEIIDILIPKKAMVPRLHTILITAIKRGSITPLNDLKLNNNTIAITKNAMGKSVVNSFRIKSDM